VCVLCAQEAKASGSPGVDIRQDGDEQPLFVGEVGEQFALERRHSHLQRARRAAGRQRVARRASWCFISRRRCPVLRTSLRARS
jgi:hypothetical protein